jgi:hypothetical protein
MSRRASAAMKGCQILPCGNLELFAATLSKVRAETNVCIISCLTNFVTSSTASGSVSQRVDGVLEEIGTVLLQACKDAPTRSFMVSPLMYRTTPVWYRDGLPEILTLFSQALCDQKPSNLHILPSFPTPEFEEDGVHLTAFSGLEFVISLFDFSEDLLDGLKKSPLERCSLRSEDGRVLEDRVMVLEQDHRRLNRFVEHKSAVDAELADFRENERFEDSFVISGLPGVSASLSGKEWQSEAVKSVQTVIGEVLGKEVEIVVVQNVTSRQPGAETTYNVRLASIEDSKALRRRFGSYFKAGQDTRPPSLRAVSIKNRVTSDTKIRISVLKLMAKRYRDTNPGAKVQVIGFEPRPMLKIVPPSSSGDRRTRLYNYVEACRAFPASFPAADVQKIMRRINPRLRGQIKSTFIVLNDDMLSSSARDANRSSAPDPSTTSSSESVDVEVQESAEPDDGGFETVRGRRGQRRRADSPPGSPAAKR